MNNSRQFGKNVFTFIREVRGLAVRFAAIAAFLFYFNAIPVKFALTLSISSGVRFGAGASVFEGRFALRGALRRARREKVRKSPKRKKPSVAQLRALLKAARYLVKHMRIERLRAEGRVCAGDAAQTALLCGCAHALEGALSPLALPGAVRFSLAPDFSGSASDVTLSGMVSLRLGHIMLAALIAAGYDLRRRIEHGKASH